MKLPLSGRLIMLLLILMSSLEAYSQSYRISTFSGQTVTTCTGIFYDSGGPLGDYSDNENYTVSFCSGNGNAVKFDFTTFVVRTGDTLYVYDGPDTSSPLKGKFSNTVVPVSLISSGTCMTFKFLSDALFTRPGWAANISCCPPPVTSAIGPTNPYECAGSTVTYSVDMHPGSTYNWTVTNGTPTSVTGGTNTLDITWDLPGDVTGSIKVVEVNGCGSKDSSELFVDINALPVVNFSGLSTYYCIYSAPATLTGSPAGGLFSGPGITGNVFNPSAAGAGTQNITYTYTDPSTLCTNQKMIQTTVTVPVVFAVGASATSYCAGSGVNITLSGSETGVNYQLLKNGINDGAPIPGTGSALTWINKQNGVYTVVATFVVSSCTNNMSGSQTITQNPLPTPTFTSQPGAAACTSASVTYTTQPGMSNYVWGFTGTAGTDYLITGGGTPATSSVTLMWLTTGSKTVTVNYTDANGCTAAAPATSTPTIVSLTPAAPTGAAVQNFCSEVSPTVANLNATGALIKWYLTAVGGASLPPATPLINNTNYFATQTVTGCESSARLDVTAMIFSIPPAPVAAPGTGATCSQITANWASSAGAASYRLDVSTVITFASYVAGYQDLNAGNVTSLNVTGLVAGNTYYYRVRAVDFCGTSTNSGTITYATLPAAPATPGAITGVTTQCPVLPGENYSITAVPNATTYTWSVPAGWTITAGQGTISITVTTGSPGQNGNITVTAGNTCGTSAPATLAVTVSPNSSITSVTGPGPLCIGGTATYSANGVVLSGGVGSWSSSNPAIATVSATGLVTGVSVGTCNIIYTITGGCGGIKSAQQSVTISPNASITSVTGVTPLCIGGTATYAANGVVLSGGAGAWSSSNPAIATVSAAGLVTGVSAGTCNIIYTITGGCGGNISAQQAVTIDPNASIVSVTGTTPLCTGATATYSANGVVLSGGIGAWSSSNPAVATVSAAGLVTAVAAGTCNIVYTITGGCGGTVSALQSVTVNPDAAVASVTGSTPLCIGGTSTYTANGVVPGGGTGAWSSSNPAVATVSAAGLVSGVSAGTCNIIYTITGGCGGIKSAQQAVTINTNASITSVTGASPLCIGGTATYTANGVVLGGGIGAWSSSNTSVATVSAAGLVTAVSPGTCNIIYSITGGCGGNKSAQQSVTVNPNAGITSVTGASPLCLGGTATYSANGVVPGGGTGAWSSSDPAVATVSAAGLVTGIAAGTCNIIYTITGGCGGNKSAQQSVTVNPNAKITSVTGATPLCIGATATYTANGVVLGGGTGSWFSSNTAVATVTPAGLVTGVSPGTCNIIYSITGGCGGNVSSQQSVTIRPNASVASVTGVSPLCIGATANYTVNGVVLSGGVGAWSSSNPAVATVSATGLVTGISAGTCNIIYTVTGGCGGIKSAQKSVTVNPNASIASVTGTTLLCVGGTSTYNANGVVLSGGTGAWSSSNPAVATVNAAGLVTGITAGSCNIIYTITGGCGGVASASSGITIEAKPVVTGTVTNVLCTGNSTGAIDITVTGGTGPFTFTWTGAGVIPGTEDQSGLKAGPYSVIVTDAAICSSLLMNFTIAEPPALSVSILSQTNVSVSGGNDGSVTVTGAGGVPPYQYNINGGSYQASGTFGTLTAGTYTVTVKDNNSCTAVVSVIITEPVPPLKGTITSQTDVICFGASTGSVTVAGSDGVPPYEYSLDGGSYQSSGTFSSLAAGNHTVTVKDAALTTVNVPVIIAQPAIPFTGSVTVTNVSCFGGSSGAVDLTVTGGTAPFVFNWSNGITTEDLSGITSGNYTALITDANNCTANASATVSEPAAPLTGSAVVTAIPCPSGSTGAINLTVSGGTAPFTFSWSNGASTEDLAGLTSGTYTVTITDAGGCTASTSAKIAELSASVASTDISCHSGTDGSIDLTVSDGTPPYTFLWNNGATTEDLSGLSAGIYSVTITDAAGCSLVVARTITEPAALDASVTVTDIVCAGTATGAADLTVSGGTAPYTFLWSNGFTGEDLASVPAGVYNVTITDSKGCNLNSTATITESGQPLTLSIVSQKDITCSGAANGSITVAGAGGVAPYEYSLDNKPFQASGDFSDLAAGTFTITVRDGNLCTTDISATFNDPIPVAISFTKQDASCPDINDGSITLTPTGGKPAYKAHWLDGDTTLVRQKILKGTYNVIVTDANGCTASAEIIVDFTGTGKCLEIPNIITPNGDGYNDIWILRNIDLFPNAEVFVYNRWGELVFHTKNILANPWNGTSNGKLLPTDSYHYVLHLNDGSEARTGVISIIR